MSLLGADGRAVVSGGPRTVLRWLAAAVAAVAATLLVAGCASGSQSLGSSRVRRAVEAVVCRPDRVVCVSASRFGQAARHIADAQRAGASRILRVNRTGVAERRAAATSQLLRLPGVDRDEYPPAFARSVGQAVSVRYIDPFSNRGLGASLGAATRRLDDRARFLVTVVR